MKCPLLSNPTAVPEADHHLNRTYSAEQRRRAEP
jgi:hypothetical protein